jgi:hypothetical protein
LSLQVLAFLFEVRDPLLQLGAPEQPVEHHRNPGGGGA